MDLDLERASGQIDALIERRAREAEEANRLEAAWAESCRTYNLARAAERREARADFHRRMISAAEGWAEHYRRMIPVCEASAQRHRDRLAALIDEAPTPSQGEWPRK